MWLHTLGEALLGLHWENYCNTLVCTKLHNKKQRKAHSLATTSTSGPEEPLNIGSSCLLLPANIMLFRRNPDGYSASLLCRQEVCLRVGVFTDVIIKSYINSTSTTTWAVLVESKTVISITPCQCKSLDICLHIPKLSSSYYLEIPIFLVLKITTKLKTSSLDLTWTLSRFLP